MIMKDDQALTSIVTDHLKDTPELKSPAQGANKGHLDWNTLPSYL